jgi:hypothetical protein
MAKTVQIYKFSSFFTENIPAFTQRAPQLFIVPETGNRTI